MENSSCSYIRCEIVQMMSLMMLIMGLMMMMWKIYYYSVSEKIIGLLEVTFFQNVVMITSVISPYIGGCSKWHIYK